MTEYPGVYLYQPPLSCSACMDEADLFGCPDCVRCRSFNSHKVKLLRLDAGIFGTKAVIRRLDSGRIETVPVNTLKYIED